MTAASASRYHVTPRFALESGEVLRDVEQAYALEGTINEARDNVVLVFHSLTGSPETLGGWKGSVIGPGKAVDTRKWAVLCPNLLGSCYGTTFKRFPRRAGKAEAQPTITTRDQARLVLSLIESLGIPSPALVTGGSLGGMVALEWAAKINGKSPTAQRMLKFSFNLIDDGLVGQQVFAGEATRLAYMTDEAAEGRDSFLEKRDPDWSPYPWHF